MRSYWVQMMLNSHAVVGIELRESQNTSRLMLVRSEVMMGACVDLHHEVICRLMSYVCVQHAGCSINEESPTLAASLI